MWKSERDYLDPSFMLLVLFCFFSVEDRHCGSDEYSTVTQQSLIGSLFCCRTGIGEYESHPLKLSPVHPLAVVRRTRQLRS